MNGCTKANDAFMNIVIYILIIMGIVAVSMTVFCCYLTFILGKTIKESLPAMRGITDENQNNNNNNPRGAVNN